MDKKKRGCLWAALGALVLAILVAAAVVGGMAWLVYQSSSISQERATPEAAAATFERTRARLASQVPLLSIDDQGRPEVRSRDGHGRGIESLNVLSYDPREQRVFEVRLPFWLVRLGGAKAQIATDNDAFRDLRGTRLSVGDIERAGPGLLLDREEDDGRHVLIWTE